jgi:two-component system, cell cycle response regulator DivK
LTTPPAGPLVLVADDNADGRDLYSTFLGLHGYQVATAENGQQAIDQALVLGPAVIVMDGTMPEMDGWTACRLLKDDPRTASIPIIVLTGHSLGPAKARAKAAGCNSYLVKPCLPETLLAEIELQLSSSM